MDTDRSDGRESCARRRGSLDAVETGFAIGGIPPLGHAKPLRIWIDRDLTDLGAVWAAAGTPRAVFELPGQALAVLAGGAVVNVTADEAPG